MELQHTAQLNWWTRVCAVVEIWRRPRLWLAYTLAFGITTPLVCFAVATRIGMFGRATLPLDLYVLVAVATTSSWLFLRRRVRWLDGFAAGVFVGGAAFAAPLALFFGYFGVAFLAGSPFYRDAEMALAGALGVQPIFAFVAYAANAAIASKAHGGRAGSGFPLLLGFLLSSLLPLAAWLEVNALANSTERAVLDTARPLEGLHLERWRVLAPGYDWPRLDEALSIPHDDSPGALELRTERDHRIADAYRALTGRALGAWD
jgi:hypothetical protein